MPDRSNKKKKAPSNLNSVPTEDTQFPLSGFYDVLSPFKIPECDFLFLRGPAVYFSAFISPQSLEYRSAAREEVEGQTETERDGRRDQSRSEIFMVL